MIASMPPVSVELIRGHKIAEGQAYEFKSCVDFDDARAKANFIDDVVAFLNAAPGHIIIGIREKKGMFDRFVPFDEDRDPLIRRVQSIIQDNVQPKPLAVRAEPLDVDGGFLLDIIIPEHLMRPYQNKIAPGFYIRTGAKNTPLSPDELRALFKSQEEREKDTIDLMQREDRVVGAVDRVVPDSATLHIAIVPQQHYQRDFPTFEPGKTVLKVMRPYFGGAAVFKGSDRGFEIRARDMNGYLISRFFIGDDWLIHSWVAHPFTVDASGSRLTLPEFRKSLKLHLSDIQLILDDSQVRGPFTLLIAVRNLHSHPRLRPFFPRANSAQMSRALRVERLDDEDLITRFCDKVRGVSIHG
jgi:hypothetical protein